MFTKYGLFIVVMVVAALVSACAGATEAATKKQIEVEFVNHITAEMPEQDVYVAKTAGASEIYRIDQTEAAEFMKAPVYAANEAVEHDPFVLGDSPFGPYPKGIELGFTLEEWLAGRGSGAYTVEGDQAEMDFTFEKLVPNGVYTMWCAIIYVPPEFEIIDEPCGAADGSQNTFVADDEGKAEFHLTLAPLPDTTDTVLRTLAIAYHSDGKTYGASPGDFGLNSHVQLFFGLPAPESEAWQVVSSSEVAAAR